MRSASSADSNYETSREKYRGQRRLIWPALVRAIVSDACKQEERQEREEIVSDEWKTQ